jgi:molecular chaperone IbpA
VRSNLAEKEINMVSKTFVYNDLVSLMPHMIGFDRVLQQVQNYHSNNTRTTPFPPYNIRKVDEFNYQVEMAVAGYGKDDIEVKVADGTLTVRSTNETNDVDENVIHQGIAKRKFTREFALADDVVVKDASLKDGLLVVHMEKIVPEEKKPRVIEVK